MKPSDPDSPSERRLAEALRAALPPRPPGAPPERVSDAFFDALAAEDAAAGIRPPDVTERVVAAACRAARISSCRICSRFSGSLKWVCSTRIWRTPYSGRINWR